MKTKKLNRVMIIGQVLFLTMFLSLVYFYYPKTSVDVNGNIVKFSSINSKVIEISENPDFSNSRYIDLEELNNKPLRLDPGVYYWRSDNGLIQSIKNEFIIDSEVSLGINRENGTRIENLGNVKINITKGEDGVMLGHVILEPDESQEIEDKGVYKGRQLG